MKRPGVRGRRGRAALIAVTLATAIGVVGRHLVASDHQQTALTELSPRMDITDMYVFPGGDNNTATDRVTLVMVTSSPLTPAQSAAARFDPNLLYQFKIDNSLPADGIEDLVIQVTFDSTSNNTRLVNVRGPVAPPTRMDAEGTPLPRGGTATVLLRNAALPSITARPTDQVVTVTNPAGDIRIFAGVTDDPFFVDLEQFFRILPDRKPVSGPLSMLPDTATATAFRGPAPPFDTRRGGPVNFLRGINALSIVIELPESLLTPGAKQDHRGMGDN